jgi:hypothetical protein
VSARNSHAAKAARRAARERRPLADPHAAITREQAVEELRDWAHKLMAVRLDDKMAVHGSAALWGVRARPDLHP